MGELAQKQAQRHNSIHNAHWQWSNSPRRLYAEADGKLGTAAAISRRKRKAVPDRLEEKKTEPKNKNTQAHNKHIQ